jgi:hypothetical protein
MRFVTTAKKYNGPHCQSAQMEKCIHYFVTENDKARFLDWVNELDMKSQGIVDRLIQRVACGGAKKSVENLRDDYSK